jgi:hypothetical protein
MDFHAHMDRNEIIGLLAGSWHPQQVRALDELGRGGGVWVGGWVMG